MEHLRHYLDELEESYGELMEASARAANWAEATEGYSGEMFSTVNAELLEVPDAEARYEEAVEKAYSHLTETENSIFQLSGEIQRYMDGRTYMPEELVSIDERLGQIRAFKESLKEELKIIKGEKVPEDYIKDSHIRQGASEAKILQNNIKLHE